VFDLIYWGKGGFSFEQVWNMPIYLRRYYINKISDIHKKEGEASKGHQSSDQQAMENFENLNYDWGNPTTDSKAD